MNTKATTAIALGILAITCLAATPAALAAPTVFNFTTSDFNLATNYTNGLPGQVFQPNAVYQQNGGVATTTADYTNANGAPINFNWNLTPRTGATVNINHNLETGATAGANAGNIFHSTSSGTGIINQAAGTTVTTGGVFIGRDTVNRSGTQFGDYNLNGTLDATSIELQRTGRLNVGATGFSDAPITHNGTSGGVHNGAITATGAGGELAGLITLNGDFGSNGNLDVRGSGLTFSGGFLSTANQSVGFNAQHFITTTAVDLNGGTIGFTSNGTNPASASEINVGGIGVNDWNIMSLNFGGYVKMGVDNVTPTDSNVRFGFTTDGFSTGTLDLNGTNQTVASLSHFNATANGDVTITDTGGAGTLTVDQATDTEYRGNFEGGVSLVKDGVGTLTLNNLSGTPSSYTGDTIVDGGTLALVSASTNNNIASSPLIFVNTGATLDVTGLLSSRLDVASGQTLGGEGTVDGDVTLLVGATLEPGPIGDIGTLSFLDDLTLQGTTHIDLGATTDFVDVGGALAYGGILELHVGSGFSDGIYDLFDFASESGDFASVSLVGDGSLTLDGMGVWSLIAGNQKFTFDQSTGLLAFNSVPEPSSIALMLAGLAGLCIRRRRRSR